MPDGSNCCASRPTASSGCRPGSCDCRAWRGWPSAAIRCVARGLLHGDLYAHNILWRRDAPGGDDGTALLGDFGAASFIAADADATALERIEVRAFGCLLEELAERCDETATATALRDLGDRCLDADPAVRPDFARIDAALRALRPD